MQAIVDNLRALAIVGAAAVIGGGLGLLWLTQGGLPLAPVVTVEPIKPHSTTRTFAQVRENRGPTTAELNLVDPKTGKRNDTPATFTNDFVTRGARERSRKSTQEALDQAWSSFCTPEGRKRLKDALNDYFFHRANQRRMYESFWGREGRDFIDRAWRESGDVRIAGLVRDQYWRGYLNPDDLNPHVRPEVLALVSGVKPRGQPCS